jgi:hypothetical protein
MGSSAAGAGAGAGAAGAGASFPRLHPIAPNYAPDLCDETALILNLAREFGRLRPTAQIWQEDSEGPGSHRDTHTGRTGAHVAPVVTSVVLTFTLAHGSHRRETATRDYILRRFTTGRLSDETHWLSNKEMTKLSEASQPRLSRSRSMACAVCSSCVRLKTILVALYPSILVTTIQTHQHTARRWKPRPTPATGLLG